MSGASRTTRKSEQIFLTQIWSLIPNFAACLWYGKDLAADTMEYSRMIRKSLEELEAQLEEEFPGTRAAVDLVHAGNDAEKASQKPI